jgi:hypothetical protein
LLIGRGWRFEVLDAVFGVGNAMRSRGDRQREARQLIAGMAGTVAMLLVLLALVNASVDGLTVATFLQTAVLLGTAGIVWFYTKETQRLRETAQQQVKLMQQTFESSQRPYVAMMAERPAPAFSWGQAHRARDQQRRSDLSAHAPHPWGPSRHPTGGAQGRRAEPVGAEPQGSTRHEPRVCSRCP